MAKLHHRSSSGEDASLLCRAGQKTGFCHISSEKATVKKSRCARVECMWELHSTHLSELCHCCGNEPVEVTRQARLENHSSLKLTLVFILDFECSQIVILTILLSSFSFLIQGENGKLCHNDIAVIAEKNW